MQIQVPDDTQQLSLAAGFANIDQFVNSLLRKERNDWLCAERRKNMPQHAKSTSTQTNGGPGPTNSGSKNNVTDARWKITLTHPARNPG